MTQHEMSAEELAAAAHLLGSVEALRDGSMKSFLFFGYNEAGLSATISLGTMTPMEAMLLAEQLLIMGSNMLSKVVQPHKQGPGVEQFWKDQE